MSSSMSGVEVLMVNFRIDGEIVLYIIAASISTIVTLILADLLGKRNRIHEDQERYNKTLKMIENETKQWRDAKRAVTVYCGSLTERIAVYQKKIKANYEEMATGGSCGEQYLEKRAQTLRGQNGMVIEKMIETQRLDVEKRRLQILLQDFEGSYRDEADEFSVPTSLASDSESLNSTLSQSRKLKFHTVSIHTPLKDFTIHIQIPEEGEITLLDVAEQIKTHEQWPLCRQQLIINGVHVNNLEDELDMEVTNVELQKVPRFSWKGGKQSERSNSHGYDILKMNMSVDIGEIRWVSIRLKSGNNESHDFGGLTPRFNPTFGTERWIVSLYTEGGIAAHDVPRLISPNTELTLLVNGKTKYLYWYTSSLPIGKPCSTMQLLTHDFPFTPCVQTHGVGAEFEILEV